ncbi:MULTISPECIES: lasso peptide biosynthesis B2 protein [Oligella]|uniref:Microcin J25-processing protein McjB C-terminal domain-containing protein n=1 Tax=Oligella urethralis TaxID=90245 RepID=A0A2X1VIW3_9BURK|nr:lasso peptide biosynthesis B2 protein [Oligella urethralis]SPY08300.1 Uncharacterised protein [Oligella urethralis]SUA61318.1 Uncharacterised protein [Oligella urethralis]
MKYLKFKSDYYPITIDNELIVLDICSNNFFFFNEEETQEILELTKAELPVIPKHLSFLFEKSDTKFKIISYIDIKGIDNYSWSNVKHFRRETSTRVKFYDKFIIILLFIVFQVKKNSFLKFKIKTLRLLKKAQNKSSDTQVDYANSVANYINKISKYLPFKLKCLEFSFILATFLSFKKINCTLYIGVQKYDFLSHAWVSIDNKVIGDYPYLSESLAIIFTL